MFHLLTVVSCLAPGGCHRNLKRFHIRGKKDKAVVAEPTVEEEILADSDPIMEEREDAGEDNGVQVEESRGSDERSPTVDSREPAQNDDSEPTDEEKDSTPSAEKEELLKEEADVKPAVDETHPIENVGPKDVAQSMDEDLTLDADATTVNDEGCHTPAHTPAFCGCFAA